MGQEESGLLLDEQRSDSHRAAVVTTDLSQAVQTVGSARGDWKKTPPVARFASLPVQADRDVARPARRVL
jgi:hypothetical protein